MFCEHQITEFKSFVKVREIVPCSAQLSDDDDCATVLPCAPVLNGPRTSGRKVAHFSLFYLFLPIYTFLLPYVTERGWGFKVSKVSEVPEVS